ncbi:MULTISPECIES: hypothetical protein [unclassified Streptomyces]|uniref:hypothetical protein n=1 Tax=unclassified Streptomyces TaxID=2593676 RepID=UPI0005BAF422|nr:hypothetical protein [Streptomyces sp. Tu6071]
MSEGSDAQQWLREGARQSIRKYRSGDISLRSLIDDLDSVSSNLATSPLSEEIRSQWWVLEEIYAVALDRGDLHELPREDALAIQEALDVLERLFG